MHVVTSSARLQSTGTLYTTPIPYVTTKGDTDRPNAHKKPILSITLYYTLFGGDSNKIHIPVHYTGYVVEPLKDVDRGFQKQNSVLVSAGGGADGYDLINPCIKAWQHLYQRGIVKDRKMVIFTGPFMPQAQYADLEHMCNGGPFQIDRFTSHFLQWMQCADLSISRVGYNTCMNILETCTKAILVPGALVSDQKFRAKRMATLGLAECTAGDKLNPFCLAEAIQRGLAKERLHHNISLNGAEETRLYLANFK